MTESLRRNVNASFGAALFLLLLIGGVCYWSVSGFVAAAGERLDYARNWLSRSSMTSWGM